MMVFLGVGTWIRLVVWTIIGALVYVFYGYHHSRVRTQTPPRPQPAPPPTRHRGPRAGRAKRQDAALGAYASESTAVFLTVGKMCSAVRPHSSATALEM